MLESVPHIEVPQAVRVGDYLTDLHRLWYVLNVVPEPAGGPALVLEDCRSLRAEVYSAEALDALPLHRVTP